MALIELNNISFTYPTTQTAAIQNVSLEIERGQFIVLFGASGSGKSTLLRLLKKDIQPHGKFEGEIKVNGKNIQHEHEFSHTNEIGFVFQDPENQVVADDVLHEIVFGLENIGLGTNEMRSRVAEMVNFFGVVDLLHRKTHELSGGMKQQINLASFLLMQPDILILDEPTSQLDPVSARELLDMLVRLNEEFGMTIIIAEHRLEEVFTFADKIFMMEDGTVKLEGTPRQLMERLWNSELRPYVPSIPSLYLSANCLENIKFIPLSVKEGRTWIQSIGHKKQPYISNPNIYQFEQKLLEVKELFFRYQNEDDFVIQNLNFTLNQGEIYALLGGNGSGKSTFLKILASINKPSKGRIKLREKPLKSLKTHEINKNIAFLPQNPKLFFIHDTIDQEIQETMIQWGISDQNKVSSLLERLGITHLSKSHPYDLSGGEIQKAALACLLLRDPEILLLDEPTKGLDPVSKHNLATILQELKEEGKSVVMSTHDIEFAAQYATKCGMLFQGNITSENTPKSFFKGNFFYTTMVQRIFRNLPFDVVTLEEAIPLCDMSNESKYQ